MRSLGLCGNVPSLVSGERHGGLQRKLGGFVEQYTAAVHYL